MQAACPCVLVVEDEYEIAMDITRHLESAGCLVLGPVGSVASALAIVADRQVDAAALDIRLRHGETVYPLVRELRARRIPYAFTTSHGRSEFLARAPDAVLIPKPYSRTEITGWVRSLMRLQGRRTARLVH